MPENRETNRQPDPSESVPITIAEELQPPQAKPDASERREHRQEVRDYVRLGIEVIALLAIAIGGCIAYRQLRVMQDQLTTYQRQLETTDRPWLTAVPSLNTPFTINTDGNLALSLSTRVKNIGHSVARQISIEIEVYPQEFGVRSFDAPLKHQDGLCARAAVRTGGFQKMTLFPNDEDTQSAGLGIAREQAIEAAKTYEKFPYPPLNPIVVGCVTYGSATATEVHHTRFAYNVFMGTPGAKNPELPYLFNLNALAEDLKLFRLVKFPNAKTQDAD